MGLQCRPRPPCGCAIYGAGGALVWSEAGRQVCWFWRLLEGFPMQANASPHVPGRGPPGGSCKVICSWLPLVQEVLGRCSAAN